MPLIQVPATERFEFTEEDLKGEMKTFVDAIKKLCEDYSITAGFYGKKQILEIDYITTQISTKSGPIHGGEVEIKITI